MSGRLARARLRPRADGGARTVRLGLLADLRSGVAELRVRLQADVALQLHVALLAEGCEFLTSHTALVLTERCHGRAQVGFGGFAQN